MCGPECAGSLPSNDDLWVALRSQTPVSSTDWPLLRRGRGEGERGRKRYRDRGRKREKEREREGRRERERESERGRKKESVRKREREKDRERERKGREKNNTKRLYVSYMSGQQVCIRCVMCLRDGGRNLERGDSRTQKNL